MNEILQVEALSKHFPVRTGMFAHTPLRAVDGVSFTVKRGETVGLVGESGSGKTTLGLCVLRLVEPTEGRIVFAGQDFTHVDRRTEKALRRQLQAVFQDPLDSLNPRMTVGETVAEPLRLYNIGGGRRQVRERVLALFQRVNLGAEHIDRYPHQLSGGQRQRVAVARALATEPQLVVLDEPTSALDVSVQAQLLNLLRHLQDELGLSYIFISHDLAVVSQLADRVAVMYLGQIVEFGPTAEVFEHPRHPYTMSLLSAIPGEELVPEEQRIVLRGEVPSPLHPPSGCRFRTRCPFVADACYDREQTLEPIGPEHTVACHRVAEGVIPPFSVVGQHATATADRLAQAEATLRRQHEQLLQVGAGA